MPSILMRNPAVLRMALCAAAEDRYEEEFVNTQMEELEFGPDRNYDSKDDWIHDTIKEWLDKAVDRLPEIGNDLGEDSATALRYLSLKVGEQIILTHDVRITRVPGGWVYLYRDRDVATSTFIPYTEEA